LKTRSASVASQAPRPAASAILRCRSDDGNPTDFLDDIPTASQRWVEIREEIMRFYETHCTCTLFGVVDDTEMFDLFILGDDGIPNYCSKCNDPFVVTFIYERTNIK
jgi:hypothetical protein